MNWEADFAGLSPITLPDGRRYKRWPTVAPTSSRYLREHARWGVVAELIKAAELAARFDLSRG